MQTIEELASQSIPETIRPSLTDTAVRCVEAAAGGKAQDISIIDLTKLEMAPTHTFVICTGNSTTRVSAIADNVREYVQKHTGRKPYNYAGYRNCQWIVLDYGDVMMHIFLPDAREFYNIEELWCDAQKETLPNID